MLFRSTSFPITVTSYPVVIGAGGAGGTFSPSTNGTVGSATTFGSITSPGGGYGATWSLNNPGGSGGSGGGGAYTGVGGPATGTPGGTQDSVSPASGWGNPGGNSIIPGTPATLQVTGGGGGAGSAGSSSPTTAPGGNGLQYSITGITTYFAGGGGGTVYPTGTSEIGRAHV